MVEATFDGTTCIGRIILRPNRSLSWAANVRFLKVFAVLSLATGGFFLIQGLWPVMLFSVAGTALFAAAMHRCAQRCYQQEVITFSADALHIERGNRKPESCQRFQRLFARICVTRSHHPWYPTQIVIRSHGIEVPVGEFLNPSDKDQLIHSLQEMVQQLDPRPSSA